MDHQEQSLRQEYAKLLELLKNPATLSTTESPKLTERRAELDSIIALFDERTALQNSRTLAEGIASDKGIELVGLAESELEKLGPLISANKATLEKALASEYSKNDQSKTAKN